MKHCLQVTDCNCGEGVNLNLYQTVLTRDKINAEINLLYKLK